MKSYISKFAVFAFSLVIGTLFCTNLGVSAEEGDNSIATSITISPVSKIMQLAPNSTYEDSFKVSNNADSELNFEVYASPYSYNYSEQTNTYQLGFNKENTYTQITRWISFLDESGNYVETTKFTAQPNSSMEVKYRVVTPESIPAGGQYAVLFAHTLSNTSPTSSGIMTEASPGLVIYGRSTGETIIEGEISDLQLHQTKMIDGEEKNIINGSAKVKNTGNVDFMAHGTLKVTGIFGNTYYETPNNSTRAKVSIIPDAELEVTDSWDDTPFFGLFNVEWTVGAGNEEPQTISQQILILPPIIIVVMILLLTIIIVWIIMLIRRRRERKSRFLV